MWVTRRALLLHLVALTVVPGFMGLAWWQLHRALGGNSLSWAYTFEWPFFAGYAVFVWWKMVHQQPDGPEAKARAAAQHAERPVGWALEPARRRRAGSTTPSAGAPDAAGTAAAAAAAAAAAGVVAGAEAFLGVIQPDAPVPGAELGNTTGKGAPTGDGAATGDGATASTRRGTDGRGDQVAAAHPAAAGPAIGSDPANQGGKAVDDEDEALAEYNRYLAALNASGRRKTW